jgi:hypothetical protein
MSETVRWALEAPASGAFVPLQYGPSGTSGMNQTLGVLVLAQNSAQNGHYRRTQV